MLIKKLKPNENIFILHHLLQQTEKIGAQNDDKKKIVYK